MLKLRNWLMTGAALCALSFVSADSFAQAKPKPAPAKPAPKGAAKPDADPQKAVIRAFVDAYSARFGAAPPPAAGYAADAMMLAAQAIRTAKSLDFEMMRQGLDATRNAVGVTGTFTYWSSDHRSHDPKSLRLVEVTPAGLKLLD